MAKWRGNDLLLGGSLALALRACALNFFKNVGNLPVLDKDGYRFNVGIVLVNALGQVFWARRVGGQDAWQFPQGGLDRGETAKDAVFRELYEEVGITEKSVRVVSNTKGWLRYRLPKSRFASKKKPRFIGQKQKWYLLELLEDESVIDLNASEKPEFDEWRWVSYYYPIKEVIDFKQTVYRLALTQLAKGLSKIRKE